MLFTSELFLYLCKGLLVLWAFLFICASYAYRLNANRQNNDPQKRDFYFGAIFLAPFTWPFFVLAYVLFSITTAIIYSFCLALAILGLLVIRRPFLLIWLKKIGDRLLEANTVLIKMLFGTPSKNHAP